MASSKLAIRSAPTQRPASKTSSTPAARRRVYVFGDGSAGELGLGSVKGAVDVFVPKHNPHLDNVVQLSAGGMHGVALTEEGEVLTWGVNDQGALGRKTNWKGRTRDVDEASDDEDEGLDLNPLESTPTRVDLKIVDKKDKVIEVAAGDSSTFVVTEAGQVYGWGSFRNNKGDSVFGFADDSKTATTMQKTPMHIEGLENTFNIAAGADFVLTRHESGKLNAWGAGEQGETGHRMLSRHRNPTQAQRPSRVCIPPRMFASSIHVGSNHAFALNHEGTTYAWGLNNYGQTGLIQGAGGELAVVATPQKVKALADRPMKMIAGGAHHSVGLTRDGKCLVWGRCDGGQMGFDVAKLAKEEPDMFLFDLMRKPRILLEPYELASNVDYVAAGTDHSLYIQRGSDGQTHVFSWGFNVNYQCGYKSAEDVVMTPREVKLPSDATGKKVWVGAGGQYSMIMVDSS